MRRDAREDEAHGSDADPRDEQLEEPLGVDVDPDVGVRLGAPRRASGVDDGAAVAELRLRLDLDVAVERLDERRVDDVRDGHRIVDRRAVEAVALPVELEEEVRELGDEAAGAAGVAQPLGVRRREERLVRDVEPDHRDRDPAREHQRRRLGVDERVELGGRRDVPLAIAPPIQTIRSTVGHVGARSSARRS